MRHVFDRVAGLCRPGSELPGEQGIGCLIRRKVWGDVQDPHRSVLPLAGSRPDVCIAELGERCRLRPEVAGRVRKKLVEPLAEGVELALGPVVWAAADDCFARMKQQVQDWLAGARESLSTVIRG